MAHPVDGSEMQTVRERKAPRATVPPERILVVEDNPADARLLREALLDGGVPGEPAVVGRLDEALDALRRERFGVVLLDLSLPDSDGRATARRVLDAAAETAVVVLTGLDDDALAAELLHLGVQDYLLKGERLVAELPRAIRIARDRKRLDVDRRRAERALALLQRIALHIAGAEDLDTAIVSLLREVCRATGWLAGEAWLPTPDGTRIRRGAVWTDSRPELEAFHAAGAACDFERGQGLPGRAWASGEATWVPDASTSPDFCRAELARSAGLRGAMVVPVLARDEVVAVLTFYHLERLEPDRRLLELVSTVGVQVGGLVQRRALEGALRASEARLRRLVDTANDGIWILDANGRIEYVNDRLAEMLGREPAEMQQRPVFDFIATADHETARQRLARRRDGTREAGELRLRPRDGRQLCVLASGSPIQGEHGEFLGSFGVLTDITDRIRAEEAERLLAEAGAIFASSLDSRATLRGIAELLASRLGDWCVIDLIADSGEEQTVQIGATDPARERLLREMLESFPHHASHEAHPVGRVLYTGEPVLVAEITPAMLARWAPAAAHRELLERLQPRSSLVVPMVVDGRIRGLIALTRARPKPPFEPRDLALLTDLAHRAALAVENARLYETATRALRARDEVLGFVAHDLRNPLSAVSMCAQLLLEDVTDAGQREHARAIVRSAEQMDRLIQDLLDVGRLEAGSLRVEAAPTAVAPLIERIDEMLGAAAAEAGLTFEAASSGTPPPIQADADRILQVLSNLVGNAIKFTPRGGTVRVRAEARDTEVVFEIADTGVGIEAEQLPRLFDRFWQARSAHRGGAGLGLVIAKGLVEAHGGRLWLQSRPGEGTTFFFSVPVAGTGAPVGDAPLDEVAATAATAAPVRVRRVVLADDHPVVLSSVEQLLERTGRFEVVARVTSGEQAVERARTLHPDVVLMDLAMPGIGGIEAIRRIVALELGIRVVALTANAEEESLIAALEAGACGYVPKSAAHQELLQALDTALGNGVPVGPAGNRLLLRRFRARREQRDAPLHGLNEQERAVLALAAEGFTSAEIGKRLYLSPKTVDTYRSRLMRKLGLGHRAELVRFAVQTELLTAD